MQDQREHDAKLFLDVIFGKAPQDAITTLSFVSRGGASAIWNNRPYTLEQREQLIRDALAAKTQVYIRIPPMGKRPLKGRGLEADSLGSGVLWCDLDCYGAQDEGLAQLEAMDKPPTLVINSGYGLQGYWVLDRFYEGVTSIKTRNKALSVSLNGGAGKDKSDSVFDLARVMRFPGSFNLKQNFPALVKVESYNPERVYTLEQFEEADLDETAPIDTWEEEPLPEDFIDGVKAKDKKLADRIIDEAKALKAGAPARKGDTDKVDRSRNDQHIAIRLLALGYTPGVVMSVLTHSTWLSGARWRERRNYDYVVSTVNKAGKKVGDSPDRYFSGKSFVPSALGAELMKVQPFLYVAEELWRYDSGVFKPAGERWILEQAREKLGDRWQSQYADSTVRWIKDGSYAALDEVNQFTGLVNVQNGMLNVDTLEMLPHNPKYRSLAQLPVIYDPDVDCSRLDRFIAQVLPEDAIPMFWEFIGSSLDTNHYFPKAMVALVGPKDSGKSKVLEYVNRLIGRQHCANLSFKTLAEHKFATYELIGKFMNIFADLEEGEARDTGQLKALTGDDIISGERKFKNVVSFKNTARLLFSSNHYMQVKSPDNAFFERVFIIPCRNVFKEGMPGTDPNIVDKMSSATNLSAGFLRMLQGFQRLQAQKWFTPSPSVMRERGEYIGSADTVTGFIVTRTEVDNKSRVSVEAMYQEYAAWCKLGNRTPFSDQKFYRRMMEGLKEFKLERQQLDLGSGRQQWCYVGRKVIPQYEEVHNGFILN